MSTLTQTSNFVNEDGIKLEAHERCELCGGRLDYDVDPRLTGYDYWCGCPLPLTKQHSVLLGEPYSDESGLPCWFRADGLAILKPYPSGEGLSTPAAAMQGPGGEPLFVWPVPGLEPPGDLRKPTVNEQAARYREIKRILWSTGMTMASKMALIESYEMSGLYPGTIVAGGSIESVSLNMVALSKRMGCSARRAGRAIQDLADAGLLTREERFDSDTCRRTISVAPARRLHYNEQLPEAERVVRDRTYIRCRSCGSEQIEVRHICHACGTIDITVVPPIVQGSESENEPAEGPPERADENDTGSCIDLLSENRHTDPLVQEPVSFSSAGITLPEPSQVDLITVAQRSDPWTCACGHRVWESHSNREGTYCAGCGGRFVAPALLAQVHHR